MYDHGRLPTLTDADSRCVAFAPSACDRGKPYPSVTGPYSYSVWIDFRRQILPSKVVPRAARVKLRRFLCGGALVQWLKVESRRSRVRTQLLDFKFQRNKMLRPRSLVKILHSGDPPSPSSASDR